MFARRSLKLERIDTGDYTEAEYERFLEEIRFINQRLGDTAATEATLFKEIENAGTEEFTVLDVGAGSGELLRFIADFAYATNRSAHLVGLDLNERCSAAIKVESTGYPQIDSIQGNALAIPFQNNSFDYAICSLFTHHLTDENIVNVLEEMNRVARRGIFVIDLHRHPAAFVLYKLFCAIYRISPLVRQDGSLSILRSFKPAELFLLGTRAGLVDPAVTTSKPYRLILSSIKPATDKMVEETFLESLEDESDLEASDARRQEPTVCLEDVLAELDRDKV